MTGTRAPARDSSLRDRKAPGNVSLTHPAAPPRQCNAEGPLLPAIPGETVNSLENDRAQPCATLPLDAAPLWLSFLAMIALSLVINFVGFALAQPFMPDLAATVVAVAASTVVKYLSLDRYTFTKTNRLFKPN